MKPAGAQQYLRTKVMTATPEQLQMMLYDGALRFAEQAKVALQNKNFEQSYNLISRTQKIITEMTVTLKHDVNPDLCGKLASLYNYIYRKLIDANVHHELAALEEALNLLRFQRDTWVMLLEKLQKDKATQVAGKIDMPAPDSRMEASISMTG